MYDRISIRIISCLAFLEWSLINNIYYKTSKLEMERFTGTHKKNILAGIDYYIFGI